ncbi:MAG: hypothetical protein HOO06_02680 [Bdellovibrionaceae bacterium]|jgi:hypothetical protein|nr:hypothetical protein [Pseudobdellovibrionaceae bacterium]
MKSPFRNLIDLKVDKVVQVHDYIQLLFEREWVLNVYNDFKVTPNDELKKIQQMKLCQFSDESDLIKLVFSEGQTLIVKMSKEAWHGPEAVSLKGPDNQTFVWNE